MKSSVVSAWEWLKKNIISQIELCKMNMDETNCPHSYVPFFCGIGVLSVEKFGEVCTEHGVCMNVYMYVYACMIACVHVHIIRVHDVCLCMLAVRMSMRTCVAMFYRQMYSMQLNAWQQRNIM